MLFVLRALSCNLLSILRINIEPLCSFLPKTGGCPSSAFVRSSGRSFSVRPPLFPSPAFACSAFGLSLSSAFARSAFRPPLFDFSSWFCGCAELSVRCSVPRQAEGISSRADTKAKRGRPLGPKNKSERAA